MSVLFKLKSRASRRARDEVVRTLEDRFHRHAEPVFPGATEAELANVFALEVPARSAASAVELLSGLSAVEYAEIEPQRRLSANAAH
jgi:hypothetical protein